MAKGQMRGTKEKKKPKAEWNRKEKGNPGTFDDGRGNRRVRSSPSWCFGKKG